MGAPGGGGQQERVRCCYKVPGKKRATQGKACDSKGLVQHNKFDQVQTASPVYHHTIYCLVAVLSADNAFTAGMVSASQLQYAATFGQHPTAAVGPNPSKLLPLHEHQQQQQQYRDTSNDFFQGLPQQQQPVDGKSSAVPAKSASKLQQGASKLLALLPGGKKMQRWVNARDSWRQQQEQLQQELYDINQVRVTCPRRVRYMERRE